MLLHLAGYRPWQRATTTLSDHPTRSRRFSKCRDAWLRRWLVIARYLVIGVDTGRVEGMASTLGSMVANPFDPLGTARRFAEGPPDYSTFVSNIGRKLIGSIPRWRPTTPI